MVKRGVAKSSGSCWASAGAGGAIGGSGIARRRPPGGSGRGGPVPARVVALARSCAGPDRGGEAEEGPEGGQEAKAARGVVCPAGAGAGAQALGVARIAGVEPALHGHGGRVLGGVALDEDLGVGDGGAVGAEFEGVVPVLAGGEGAAAVDAEVVVAAEGADAGR